jgi:transcriptional regulator with XRE-family HTH domain
VPGGSLIKEARRRAALPQSELASRLGVPQSTIARWETGRIAPSFDNVTRAIRACDLELSVGLAAKDAQLEALVDDYLRMTPAERFAQNSYLVNFVEGARRRMAAAHG